MSTRHRTFEALVNAYSADMYRYAYWLCHNKALAEDLVQESFTRAWKALDKLDDHKAAKAWLFTILRRENARYFERKHTTDISLDEIELDTIIAEDSGLGNTEHFALQRALKVLPIEYREPLLLQVLGGYSCDEIATIMGAKVGAVMTRLSRSRQKMRELLTDEGQHKTNSLDRS